MKPQSPYVNITMEMGASAEVLGYGGHPGAIMLAPASPPRTGVAALDLCSHTIFI